jgi:16S rRNA (guanine527-N7)-methyltransferase
MKKTPYDAASCLEQGLELLGLPLAMESFLEYLALLNTWNTAYSLTAIRDPKEQVARYILDSLAILPWLSGTRVLDVGSGAGVPGIALAIARPDIDFTLLDSNGKKIRFLMEVKRVLGLHHVSVIQTRAELYHPSICFDTIASCAFSELAQMMDWTQHLLSKNGCWLAMKGRYPTAELESVDLPFTVHQYSVPFVNAERCCILIQNSA